jgi:Ca2+-binding EF-hand superfamily protein
LLILVALSLPSSSQGGEEEPDDDLDQDIEEESLSAEQLRSLHAKLDSNGDGKVSLQEVLQYAQAMGKAIANKDIGSIMEELDTSKDGRLTLEEHLADVYNQADGGDEEEMKELEQRKQVETAKFAAADTNGDEFLDKDELAGLFYPETHEAVLSVTVAETMRQKDANNDGKLSPKEFWEAEDFEGDDGELSDEEHMDFRKLDINGDGAIDLVEMRAWDSGKFHTEEAMKKLFEIADKDHDMHVTADELADAREQIASSDAQYHLIEWAEHHEL